MSTIVIVACSLASIGYVVLHARLAGRSGLVWRVSTPGTTSPTPEPHLAVPSTGVVRAAARPLGGQPFQAEWRGVLVPVAGAHYRFLIEADDAAEVFVDGRLVATEKMVAGSLAIPLDRRQHDLVIRYADRGGDQRLGIHWSSDGGHFRPIPVLLLVPERIGIRDVDLRRVIVRAALMLPLVWVLLLALLVAIGVRGLVPALGLGPTNDGGSPRGRNAALAAGTMLFTTGLWWGLPGPASWAPDEIGPMDVWSGLHAGFANGWSSIYPPFHHALIGVFHLPFEAAFALGIGDREDVVWSGVLLAIGRAVSVLMALGIVWAAHRIALEQFGRRAATLAAWIALAMLPLAFYAKTANADVPYVFWVSLSLLFFARVRTEAARSSDFYFFTLSGVAAVCTKDQAYGFFVLPAIYMLIGSLFGIRGPGVPTRLVLARMVAIAVAGFALLHNLPFNVSGFADHVRLIAGPGSAGFAMFANTPGGHGRMALATVSQLGQALSWPILTIVVIAIASAIAKRACVVLWLLLPCISYYVTFISVVHYHYDRFFLGFGVVLAVAAGWWVDRWLAAPHGRTLKLAAIVIVLMYALSRALALDVLMLNDPRYDVERWLRDRVAPSQRVAAIGHVAMLPRASISPWTPALLNPQLLNDTRPEVLVVNVRFALRVDEGSAARETYALLDAGTTDYLRLARFRSRVVPPLSWERRFQKITDDVFSNLTKVNPPIEIYVRRDVMDVAK